jgi:hypothetical protein
MSFPCHAVTLRVYIVSFPFYLHSAAVFDSHMPCRARAMPRPCRSECDFSRLRHSAAWAWHVWIRIGRPETARGRPDRVRLLPRTTRSSTKVIRSIPIRQTVGLTLGLSRRTRHCRRMAGARHGTGWINAARHGMAGERNGRGMTCELAWIEKSYSVQISAAWLRQAVSCRPLAPVVRVSPSAQYTLRSVEKKRQWFSPGQNYSACFVSPF